jgi:hypothetical protein
MRTYCLWHPDSPGVRIVVRRPALLRRLGIIRSPFATLGEATNKHSSIYFYPITDHAPVTDKDLTRSPR